MTYIKNTTPVGVISACGTSTIPAGWLLLNGQTVTIANYPDLAAAFPTWVSGLNITLPDFRGYFLRGYGTNTDGTVSGTFLATQGYSTARPTTSFTTNTTGAHQHNLKQPGELDENQGWPASGFRAVWSTDRNGGTPSSQPVEFNGDHSHTITGGGDSETRPKNIAVNYIIKAR
jgi:hypothetical protein